MTYRDDLDALAARHATLQAELGRKQRELAEVSGMLAEVRETRRVESFHAPDLRRRPRRHLIAAAMVVTLGSGAAVGAAAATEPGWPHPATATAQLRGHLVRIRTNQASQALAQREQAELDALRALGLLPGDPAEREVAVAKRVRPRLLWNVSPSLPPGAPWDRVIRD